MNRETLVKLASKANAEIERDYPQTEGIFAVRRHTLKLGVGRLVDIIARHIDRERTNEPV